MLCFGIGPCPFMTLLKCPAAKISHINHDKCTFDHIVLRKEWKNTIEKPHKRVLQKIKVLCHLSVKPKANVSCHINFRRDLSVVS